MGQVWPPGGQAGGTRSRTRAGRPHDRPIDTTQTAWERFRDISRMLEVHDRKFATQPSNLRAERLRRSHQTGQSCPGLRPPCPPHAASVLRGRKHHAPVCRLAQLSGVIFRLLSPLLPVKQRLSHPCLQLASELLHTKVIKEGQPYRQARHGSPPIPTAARLVVDPNGAQSKEARWHPGVLCQGERYSN